jgi:hypothetical protein
LFVVIAIIIAAVAASTTTDTITPHSQPAAVIGIQSAG